MPNPLVIIHGYSDKGESFLTWAKLLGQKGIPVESISICSWISLNNEVTVRDIAEAFDRALSTLPHLSNGEPFDALVHSTGMLVIRCWLVGNPSRQQRLKRLLAIAPATNGSPLAQQGRSVLGSIFKGDHDLMSPDFLAAGDHILDALELGSGFTWKLTHQDVLCEPSLYGLGSTTPYVFIFCGTAQYPGMKGLVVNKPGTDGTVRWAGCALNTEKITVDFRRKSYVDPAGRAQMTDLNSRQGLPIPFWPVAGKSHQTIVQDPGDQLISLAVQALGVTSEQEFLDWQTKAEVLCGPARQAMIKSGQEWQQFVIHAVDQLGEPISDFHLEVSAFHPDGTRLYWQDADLDMHTYTSDKSYRCFHINISGLRRLVDAGTITSLDLRVIATSGTDIVDYHGEGSETLPDPKGDVQTDGKWDAVLNIPIAFESGASFFYAFTTTFVELILERDAQPFGQGANRVCWFLPST